MWLPVGRSSERDRLPPLCSPEVVDQFKPPVEDVEVTPELRSGGGFRCGYEGESFLQYLQLCGCEGEGGAEVCNIGSKGRCVVTSLPSYMFKCCFQYLNNVPAVSAVQWMLSFVLT